VAAQTKVVQNALKIMISTFAKKAQSALPTTKRGISKTLTTTTTSTTTTSIASRLSTRGLRPVSYAPTRSEVGSSKVSGTKHSLLSKTAKSVKSTFFYLLTGF
jgi:hypothetical protein